MKPIALDAAGGDHMPQAAVAGALAAAREGIAVILVGDEAVLQAELSKAGGAVGVVHAADVIGMNEPATDVRRRKASSIMVAMNLVKSGEASAAVSMGHSGATMAAALLVLGRLKGVERPAILANMPVQNGYVALIDAGANADCRPVHLQQFAIMGSVYAKAFYAAEQPTVGLMSIGEEEGKGNDLTREAYALLKTTPGINFYGNVEGRDLFRATTHVVVTDGFTGNVVLKLAEGEARELFRWIKEAVQASGPLVKLGAGLVKPILRGIAAKMDPGEVGAQPLLGVNGYAFIGHGSSDARAVQNALRNASKAVQTDLVGKIAAGLERLEPAPAP